MSDIVFWSLLALVIYVYAGYPCLLAILARRSQERYEIDAESLPAVTLIISAYNENDCITQKLRNSDGLDYPKDRLQILVVSDASDDGTDEAVKSYPSDYVSLLRMEERGGKTLGLNAAVNVADGDVLIFSDANAFYHQSAIRHLAAPFVDSGIGAVIGESTYVEPDSESGRSESLYWRYETLIKKLESRSGSVVGGDGAIYAVRRELYVPMRAGDLSDFVNPLQVVQAGYRCVYEPKALSYEEAAESFAKEYSRKVRIVNRAWRALWKLRAMLNPFKFGMFSLKLWSHKVFRWLVPLLLLALLLLNLMLVTHNQVYVITLVGQLLFYTFGLIGYSLRRRKEQSALFRVPYYFCLVNLAAAIGLFEVFAGKSYSTWTTARN